ncbi:DegV family protein [Youxingia wuxianensis]|uniref:DegV family protein n=1 Tax=Youxingia wuxianensis TaxID=2763678 RepID=A0A926IH96_9FIRM|nr:DegV family protein [Youxingia wuxianensis]MBC8585061.1 DegV family protein [Youxingia wuxianensis]
MSDYIIVTDSNADLLPEYCKQHNIVEMELTYTLDDKTYRCNDPSLSRHEFYDYMRGGKMPITAQINMEETNNKLIPILEEGKDILCIMFSSGLSGSYNSVRIVGEELQGKYPDRKIVVIDSLCASLGEGLLVDKAVTRKEKGMSLEDNAQRVQEDMPHLCHYFTVADLFHLHRGGRVSATAAVFGSMLGIKPVLHVDDEGHLIPLSKVRGRKASLLALVDNMEKLIDRKNCDKFFISHGDCLDDAKFVAEEVKKRFGFHDCMINYVGPTIGAHSGPGTVALFFMGKHR